MICTGLAGCAAALPTFGRAIMLGVMSGAVTMKIISSTSITSMKGTILISLMVRRPRPRELMAGMASVQKVTVHRGCAAKY